MSTFEEALERTQGRLTSHGFAFDTHPAAFGELRDSSDCQAEASSLRQRLAEDGYVYLRGYLAREPVQAARHELCEKLDRVGLIDRRHPLDEAVFSGSTQGMSQIDRKAYAKDLRTGPALRALCGGQQIMGFYERLLGGEVLTYDYIWVRNVRVGAATGVHFDWVYMGRGTRQVFTTWTPLGRVTLEDGPLAILEGSHKESELQASYGALDVDRDRVWQRPDHAYVHGWLSKDVARVQARYGRRWLTTEFEAGDMVCFGMFTLHCSLDNRSPGNQIRLSTDTRYQLASELADERWIGEESFADGML